MSALTITIAVLLGAVSVVAGIVVFVVDSMAKATFALLVSFLTVAGIFVVLDLMYLAVVTALMMTIEMALMAVFMIMFMMNPAGLMPMSMLHNTRGSIVVGSIAFVALTVGVWTISWPTRSGSLPADPTKQLGLAIMSDQMLVMLVLGVTLFATVVAGTMLATQRGRYDRVGNGAGNGAGSAGREDIA